MKKALLGIFFLNCAITCAAIALNVVAVVDGLWSIGVDQSLIICPAMMFISWMAYDSAPDAK